MLLFCCDNNAALSPMAEAICRHLSPELTVQSAGAYSSHIRSDVRKVLSEIDIDSYGLRSKDVFGVDFDWVELAVLLCSENDAPKLPKRLSIRRWALPDPQCAPESEKRESYRALRDDLMNRIPKLLAELGGNNDFGFRTDLRLL